MMHGLGIDDMLNVRMDGRNNAQGLLIGTLLGVLGCFSFFTLQCSLSNRLFSKELLHISEKLNEKNIDNRTVLLLPPFSSRGFDTSATFTVNKIIEKLYQKRTSPFLHTKDEFERRMRITFKDDEMVDQFYQNFFKSDMIGIQTADSIWELVEDDFVLSIKITWAARIKSFENHLFRRITLEGELWDVSLSSVVWRMRLRGADNGARLSDAEFIYKGIEDVYLSLPGNLQRYGNENW